LHILNLENNQARKITTSFEQEAPQRADECLLFASFTMSLRGVRQCKELVVRYSDYDGSSRGVREWIRTQLVGIAQNNSEMQIKTEVRRSAHPFLRGIYQNGNIKTIGIKNLTPEEIHSYFLDLRNQIGRKTSSNGYKLPVLSDKPSIQGEWNERLDLIELKLKVTDKF